MCPCVSALGRTPLVPSHPATQPTPHSAPCPRSVREARHQVLHSQPAGGQQDAHPILLGRRSSGANHGRGSGTANLTGAICVPFCCCRCPRLFVSFAAAVDVLDMFPLLVPFVAVVDGLETSDGRFRVHCSGCVQGVRASPWLVCRGLKLAPLIVIRSAFD